jgi:hypothetical protein
MWAESLQHFKPEVINAVKCLKLCITSDIPKHIPLLSRAHTLFLTTIEDVNQQRDPLQAFRRTSEEQQSRVKVVVVRGEGGVEGVVVQL